MIWKTIAVLNFALYVLGDGHHAISEQRIKIHKTEHHGHYGDLMHIGSHEPEHHEEYAWSYPSYEFSYKVHDPHTHDMKGHEESRHGDNVKGEYWLIQPDGHKRTVTYHVDKHSGFQAKVQYTKDEEDHHDHHEEHHDNDKDKDHHHEEHDKHDGEKKDEGHGDEGRSEEKGRHGEESRGSPGFGWRRDMSRGRDDHGQRGEELGRRGGQDEGHHHDDRHGRDHHEWGRDEHDGITVLSRLGSFGRNEARGRDEGHEREDHGKDGGHGKEHRHGWMESRHLGDNHGEDHRKHSSHDSTYNYPRFYRHEQQ